MQIQMRDALHPDAIYRLNIDNDGDLLTDVALSYVFSKPQNGKQTFSVFLAKGAESRSVEAVGEKIIADAEVSFGPKPNIVKSGDYPRHLCPRTMRRSPTLGEKAFVAVNPPVRRGGAGAGPRQTVSWNAVGLGVRCPTCSRAAVKTR
jgi:hypothetical protein